MAQVFEIPDELTAKKQWVCWRAEEREGKTTKVPYCPTTEARASSTDPATWVSYKRALMSAEDFDGIGFVLNGQGLIGIDLDKCVSEGLVEPWAQAILDRWPDTYAEVTPSGTGLRMWLRGSLPESSRKRKGRFEIYDTARYLTVTGQRLPGRPVTITEAGETLIELLAEMFPPKQTTKEPARTVSEQLQWSERELLDKAFSAQNGAAVESLWNGDISGHGGDDSAADMALCSHLAFYAGPQGQLLVDNLFRQSALYRPKWDERHRGDGATYGQITLEKVYAEMTEFYEVSDFVELPEPTPKIAKNGNVVNAVNEKGEHCQRSEKGDFEIEMGSVSTLSTLSTPLQNRMANWAEIVPIRETTTSPFPVEALPPVLADYVANVASVMRVPVDMPAMASLAALSFATCRRWDVEINPSYVEPTNLYMAITAESGSRKSSTLEATMFPIRQMEQELLSDLKVTATERRERRSAQENTLRRKREELAKIDDPQKRESALQEVTKLSEALKAVPADPRLLVEDVTPERLVGLLLEQAGTLALISSEGGVFQTMGGRYAKGEVNLDVYLKGHDAESYRVDRLNRPAEFLAATRLAICITVQPNVLHSLSQKKEFRGRGLLGRFLYALPPDLRGTRTMSLHETGLDMEKKSAYGQAIRTLLRFRQADEGNPFARHTIAFSKAALSRHVELANGIEARQSEDGDLRPFADWASKLAGRVARIAACFHALQYREDYPEKERISEETLLMAWCIGEYLIQHAIHAFEMMVETEISQHTQAIIQWMKRNKEMTEFSGRDCYRALQRHIPSAKAVDEALRLLALNNYLRQTEYHTEKKVRVVRWEINPEIHVQKPSIH